MSIPENFHMGRSWTGHWVEDECPCPQEPCGRISNIKIVPECPQHFFGRAKTMRNMHLEEDCAKIVAEEAEAKKNEEASSKVIFIHG